MIADEQGVTVIPNNNFFANRNGLKPRWVILHGTAGGTSAVAIANYFASTEGTANAGAAHYIIGRAGEIVQTVSESDGAWGNGGITAGHDPWWNPDINPNNITISIEHCKPSTDNSDELTPAQEQASFRLVQHICERWNIPLREADASGGVTGHFSMDPVNRSRCPGPYNWTGLWAYLQKGEQTDMAMTITDPFAASHFVERNSQWYRRDGAKDKDGTPLKIMGTILGYYQLIQAAPRMPTSNEHKEANGDTWQEFEAGLLIVKADGKGVPGDSPGGNVFMVALSDPIAQDLLVGPTKAQLTIAQSQIATLRTQMTQAQSAQKVAQDQANALLVANASLKDQLSLVQATAPRVQEMATALAEIKATANKF